MKVVLDTNVLMSAIFFGGVPGRILEAWQRGRFTLGLSPAIVEEYQRVGRVLGNRYGDLGFSAILTLIVGNSEIVDPPEPTEQIGRDPDDDKFLLCAAAVGARVIVSGDADLLSLGSWNEVEVLSPRAFVDRHLSATR